MVSSSGSDVTLHTGTFTETICYSRYRIRHLCDQSDFSVASKKLDLTDFKQSKVEMEKHPKISYSLNLTAGASKLEIQCNSTYVTPLRRRGEFPRYN